VRPGRAADHSPPSSAAVMEEWGYISTHPLGHTGPAKGSLYLFYLEMDAFPYSSILTFCDCLSCLWNKEMCAEPSSIHTLKLCSSLSKKFLEPMENKESYLLLRLISSQAN